MSFNGFTGGINPRLLSPVKGTAATSAMGGGNVGLLHPPAIRSQKTRSNSRWISPRRSSALYDYRLVGGDSIAGAHFKTDLVVAADASQVVPEPATWAMMLAGAGLVAFGRRRATPTRS